MYSEQEKEQIKEMLEQWAVTHETFNNFFSTEKFNYKGVYSLLQREKEFRKLYHAAKRIRTAILAAEKIIYGLENNIYINFAEAVNSENTNQKEFNLALKNRPDLRAKKEELRATKKRKDGRELAISAINEFANSSKQISACCLEVGLTYEQFAQFKRIYKLEVYYENGKKRNSENKANEWLEKAKFCEGIKSGIIEKISKAVNAGYVTESKVRVKPTKDSKGKDVQKIEFQEDTRIPIEALPNLARWNQILSQTVKECEDKASGLQESDENYYENLEIDDAESNPY